MPKRNLDVKTIERLKRSIAAGTDQATIKKMYGIGSNYATELFNEVLGPKISRYQKTISDSERETGSQSEDK